jgi:signal peptidase I
LAGFGEVKRNDIVVFNFPAGDTVALENSASSIYNIYRSEAMRMQMNDVNQGRKVRDWDSYYNQARELVKDNYTIVVRPIDRRDNYIKRCVAVAGDSLEIIEGKIYVNGEPQPDFEGIQYDYIVQTNGNPLNPRALEDYDLPPGSLGIQYNPRYVIPLTDDKAEALRTEISDIIRVERIINDGYNFLMFPHSEEYRWNLDNFGPIYIPEEGATVELNTSTLPFYRRIIEAYENNSVRVEGDRIFINGEVKDNYTFQQDYFWMMGDNRHSSSDSRYWGYVPETHIIGKPKFIWLSLNENKKFLSKIRWDRLFKFVDASE